MGIVDLIQGLGEKCHSGDVGIISVYSYICSLTMGGSNYNLKNFFRTT